MRPRYPDLAEHGISTRTRTPDGMQEFEFALDPIIDGLERQRPRR